MKCPHCGKKLDPIEPGVIRCLWCHYPVDVSPEDIIMPIEDQDKIDPETSLQSERK